MSELLGKIALFAGFAKLGTQAPGTEEAPNETAKVQQSWEIRKQT